MNEPASGDQAPRQTLAERYGVASRRRRLPLLVSGAVVGLALLGWVGWAAWLQSTPEVGGRPASFNVVSTHRVLVVVDVVRRDGGSVTCTVSAQAVDHVTVGEDDVTIATGRSGEAQTTIALRTDREATSVTVTDCRTAD